MKIQLNKSFFITVALLIATATLAHYSALWRMKGTTGGDDVAAEKKPLYWVAPMDPNYKRDKPGKSPMGMDLIPVYEDAGGDQEIGQQSWRTYSVCYSGAAGRLCQYRGLCAI